jgi:NAD(P)-dependent dehydrogenase (short-subunit alcohol dehydrogenase family)
MGTTVIARGREEILPTLLKPTKSYEFDSNALYVIAGGLGGLGRSIARWMAGRGAKHLLLLSRSGPKHDTQHALLEELARDGVQIYAPACDITSREALRETLAHCAQNAPPIKGCIQATMVLQVSY